MWARSEYIKVATPTGRPREWILVKRMCVIDRERDTHAKSYSYGNKRGELK
jgi:hypothetical protein